ncbi:carbohydrate esterase family 16 protein [Ceratobasidium sp. AG-Ba]|nr:carbohydrate esterase family 16 protein [Ceratobasidium sp. AG-Ba]
MVSVRFAVAIGSLLASSCVSALSWNSTKYLFVFGDSYTASGYNVSAGINSPNPGWTSSNGPNWPMYLASTYNVTDTKLYNLAYGGATIDSKLVTPYLPTVQSVVDQVGLWTKYFGPHPSAAPWTSANSLFAIWIGINDISNVTQADFHKTLLDRYFSQVDILYKKGARSFLFVNVPPLERTPLFISQGQWSVDTVKASVADYNAQLAARVKNFMKSYKGLGQITVYDSNKLFNAQLDNADALGFVNITGYDEVYQNGTPGSTYQAPGSKPVSSYFWLNSLHPTFFVHNIMAHALSTILA